MTPGTEYLERPLDDTLVDVTYSFGGGTVNFEFQAFGENVYVPGQGEEKAEK